MYHRGTCSKKLGKRGRDHTPRRHIELDYALESESSRVSAISAYPRDELWEIYGDVSARGLLENGTTKNIELDKDRAYLPFEQARVDGMQRSIVMRLKSCAWELLALHVYI